jgi:hypothetical protein
MRTVRRRRPPVLAASLLGLAAALAGCGSWTHPSKPASALAADRMGCEQWAVGLYPVALVQRQVTPARQEPPRTSCTTRDAHTTCTTTPGAWIGPTFATEDANASRREDAISQCLRSAGWTWKLD